MDILPDVLSPPAPAVAEATLAAAGAVVLDPLELLHGQAGIDAGNVYTWRDVFDNAKRSSRREAAPSSCGGCGGCGGCSSCDPKYHKRVA